MKKRYIALALILVIGYLAWNGYQKVVAPNVVLDYALKIPTGTEYESLLGLLKQDDLLEDQSSFETVAGWMSFDQSTIKPGHYKIKEGWSNRELIGKLRSGNQDGVRVTVNNVRDLKGFCGKITSQLELDSVQLTEYLLSPEVADHYQLTEEEMLTLFIPNTYEFWWNSSKEDLLKRFVKERDSFWSKKNRLEKAKEAGLSKEEVYTLASIVEKETNQNSEKARIAGVYLNRLNRGILLQADPTVVYANGDFGLRRVLNKHLKFDSPYNTYIHKGLPPGPIYMPDISSIDAVLNAERHSYLYFCAKDDMSGLHAFATNLIGHNKNAQRYWRWLKKNNIR